MANSVSKNNESVKNVVANAAWIVLVWLGKAAEAVGKGIAIVVALLAMTFIFFNPLFFWPYCLLAPRKAASSLYETDLPVYMDFMRAIYEPFVALLPMFWKKHFMAVRGISNYSAKLQVKYFFVLNEETERIEAIKQMNREAKKLLWDKDSDNGNAVRVMMVTAGVRLEPEQFEFLASHSLTSVLKVYVNNFTPSEEMMESLLRHKLGDLFLSCVERYGLSARLVSKVFRMTGNDFGAAIAEQTEDALEVFSQRQMVKNTLVGGCREEWKLFLAKEKEICAAAQKMMSVWQYDEYHQAGYKLSTAAIAHFLAKGGLAMCELIFSYEPEISLKREAWALIAANPQLKSLWVRTEKKVATL